MTCIPCWTRQVLLLSVACHYRWQFHSTFMEGYVSYLALFTFWSGGMPVLLASPVGNHFDPVSLPWMTPFFVYGGVTYTFLSKQCFYWPFFKKNFANINRSSQNIFFKVTHWPLNHFIECWGWKCHFCGKCIFSNLKIVQLFSYFFICRVWVGQNFKFSKIILFWKRYLGGSSSIEPNSRILIDTPLASKAG